MIKINMTKRPETNNMRRGKIAEKIVEEMFTNAGFKVIKYGYEHTVPKLADRNNLIKGKVGDYIRHQPDFIVVNPENEAFFVEVKHRTKSIRPDREIFPYPNCYVVLLTKDLILAQSTGYLLQKKVGFQLLNKMPPFANIPYPVIEKAVLKLRRQLGEDTLINQIGGKLVEAVTNKTLPTKRSSFSVIMPTTKKGKGDIRGQKKRRRARGRSKR